MKVVTPEISWHGKEAIFSIDVQCCIKGQPRRLATAGLDRNVRIWKLKDNEVTFLSNLSRHDKAVNAVRFSKSGSALASGGDDGTVVIWKLSDKDEMPNIFEEGKNVEVWCASKLLRGHLEDINDLSWSSDDLYMVTGSVDHTAILWDVEKGQRLAILSDAKHFVNGVTWDPLGQYVATMSCDRSLRIYNVQTKKIVHCVNKTSYCKDGKSEGQPVKPQRIFHDETVVRRRLSFTVDGKMLITPAGCLQVNSSSQQVNTAMIFSRGILSKPCIYLPGLKEPASVVSCCPVLFKLRPVENDKVPIFKLDYRHIFAVASTETVLLYDTQQRNPFALISNIHYASITDLSWSSDASFLAVSSRDGFCSIICFGKKELGERYVPPVAQSQAILPAELSDKPINGNTVCAAAVEETNVKPTAKAPESMEVDQNEAKDDVRLSDPAKKALIDVAKPGITSSPQSRRVTLTTITTNTQPPTPTESTVKLQRSQPPPGKSAPRRVALTSVLPKDSG